MNLNEESLLSHLSEIERDYFEDEEWHEKMVGYLGSISFLIFLKTDQ